MIIKVDTNGAIIAYASLGGIEGGVEAEAGGVPGDFEDDFWPGKWRYEGGAIQPTGGVRPEPAEPEPDPIQAMQKAVAQLEGLVVELAYENALMGLGLTI